MKGLMLALALTVVGAPAVPAHSLKSLEDDLHKKEFYFQPLDKEAPDFELMDAGSKRFGRRDQRGKVVVLHFIYTNCPDVCPLHADRIAEIQEMINSTPMREHVRFVTITTDPKRDTPEVMREYGVAHGLDPVNWTFLTSGGDRPTATRDLVQKFGHKFTEVEGGYQVHSVVTHVIDREGRWRANFHGLKFKPVNLVLYINALVNDVHGAEAVKNRGIYDKIRELF